MIWRVPLTKVRIEKDSRLKPGIDNVGMIRTDTPNFDDATQGWEAGVQASGLNYYKTLRHPKGDTSWYNTFANELKGEGVEYRTGVFPFSANARARALGDTSGLVKFIAHAKTDEILGVHIIGPFAGELIAEAVVAMEFRGSAEDIGMITHAHPSLSEALKDAALGVDKRSLNI